MFNHRVRVVLAVVAVIGATVLAALNGQTPGPWGP